MEDLLVELSPVFEMPSDSRIPIHLFGRRYEVIFKGRDNWDEPEECVAGYTDVFYTDSAKAEQSSGVAIFSLNKNEKWVFPLGQYATVIQAGVHAILRMHAILRARWLTSG